MEILRPCIVVKRDEDAIDHENSYLYTVHVMNRPTLDEAERMHFVTHMFHAVLYCFLAKPIHLISTWRTPFGKKTVLETCFLNNKWIW